MIRLVLSHSSGTQLHAVQGHVVRVYGDDLLVDDQRIASKFGAPHGPWILAGSGGTFDQLDIEVVVSRESENAC